jgi:hypothetical protein
MGSVHALAAADDKSLALFGKTFISTDSTNKAPRTKSTNKSFRRKAATSWWQVI